MARARIADTLQRRLAWHEVRAQVFTRDLSRCRACGRRVYFASESALAVGQVHHIIYRSAGGSDDLSNLALLCAFCHDIEKRHLLDCDGNPFETLVFRKRDGQGQVIDVWGSPCPS